MGVFKSIVDGSEDCFQFILTFAIANVVCCLANETSQRQARKRRDITPGFDIKSLDGVVGMVQLRYMAGCGE